VGGRATTREPLYGVTKRSLPVMSDEREHDPIHRQRGAVAEDPGCVEVRREIHATMVGEPAVVFVVYEHFGQVGCPRASQVKMCIGGNRQRSAIR